MQSLEERVAYLEGQVSEQSHALLEVRDTVRHVERRLESRFDAVEQRMEARFDAVEQRIEARHASMDHRVAALEDKVSRQFVWLIGVQVTTFVAIVAALLSRA
jgi:uncharacterized coiled-coil protein SlyX